jgi:hypothetical protein
MLEQPLKRNTIARVGAPCADPAWGGSGISLIWL